MKKVLVACEESQVVTKEFRRMGHEAYSCDILECSGGHPDWHLNECVLGVMYDDWDLVIAHPPCTYLCNSGVRWLSGKGARPGRWELMQEGARFFKKLLDIDFCPVAVENPIMHKYAVEIIGRRQDQVIQPYMFGHPERKATCLWLKGLPALVETKNVKMEMNGLPTNEQQKIFHMPPSADRSRLRSKTFQGVAKAMAEQWGGLL